MNDHEDDRVEPPQESPKDLVALSPSDLPSVQAEISAWCAGKMAVLEQELADLHEHEQIAMANGWKLSQLRASVNRAARRITYYEKIRQAVEAGYLIVPNFPVQILAVRVGRKKANVRGHSSWLRNFAVSPDLLPAGEGRYVDDTVASVDASHDAPDGKGGMKHVKRFEPATEFDEPDFPVLAVKPSVMAATEQAMARKLFDEIAMVQNTRAGDPIMVGRLLDPRGNGRATTFFIAWWMNVEML